MIKQNEQLIEVFYAAFAAHNTKTMASCYHEDIQFMDPVFGVLKGKNVSKMWEMLIERSKGNLHIAFSDIHSKGNTGEAKWIATYDFSKTNRKVINTIYAKFEFQDGLIVLHTDHFNMWNWCIQALGFKGLLLGWTGSMHKKIQQQAIASLNQYRK